MFKNVYMYRLEEEKYKENKIEGIYFSEYTLFQINLDLLIILHNYKTKVNMKANNILKLKKIIKLS